MRKADTADTIVLPNKNVEAAVAALGVVTQEPEFADLPTETWERLVLGLENGRRLYNGGYVTRGELTANYTGQIRVLARRALAA